MAEFLIYAKLERDVADPANYTRGDLIHAAPDGHKWGIRESKQQWLAFGHAEADWPGDFVIIKIPGSSLPQARRALISVLDVNENVTKRRAWRAVWADIPAAARTTLSKTGELTVAIGTAKTYIRHRVSEAQLDTA